MDANERAVIKYVVELAKAQLHPHTVLLFGSRARGDARAQSDFDFAFDFDTARHQQHWSRFCLTVQENAPTLLPIDLVNLHEVSVSFSDKIHAEGIIVYPEE